MDEGQLAMTQGVSTLQVFGTFCIQGTRFFVVVVVVKRCGFWHLNWVPMITRQTVDSGSHLSSPVTFILLLLFYFIAFID